MRKVAIVVQDIIEDHSIRRSNGEPKKYRLGKLLGKGGFAKCWEMTSMDSGRTYAGKVIAKASLTKPSSKRKLLNEIKIHRSLKYPGVVRFERFFEDKYNVYILLEIAPHETLVELVKRRKRLTEPEVKCYMWQLVNTVAHLHANRIIHRDLKLGNLFLGQDLQIKMGDFGLAAKLEYDNERKRTICGTPNYIAPEMLDNNKEGHSYEVDVWSIGVILYTLLVGRPPFETTSVKSTYRRIRQNSYVFPESVHVSPDAKQLVMAILCSRPEQRLTLDEIMHHAFFTRTPFPALLPLSTLTTPLVFDPRHTHPRTLVTVSPASSPGGSKRSASSSSPSSSSAAVVTDARVKLGLGAPAAPRTALSDVTNAPDPAAHQATDGKQRARPASAAPARPAVSSLPAAPVPAWGLSEGPYVTTTTTTTTTAPAAAAASQRAQPVSARTRAAVQRQSTQNVGLGGRPSSASAANRLSPSAAAAAAAVGGNTRTYSVYEHMAPSVGAAPAVPAASPGGASASASAMATSPTGQGGADLDAAAAAWGVGSAGPAHRTPVGVHDARSLSPAALAALEGTGTPSGAGAAAMSLSSPAGAGAGAAGSPGAPPPAYTHAHAHASAADDDRSPALPTPTVVKDTRPRCRAGASDEALLAAQRAAADDDAPVRSIHALMERSYVARHGTQQPPQHTQPAPAAGGPRTRSSRDADSHMAISPAPGAGAAASPAAALSPGNGAATAGLWITKWVDYSNKYGLGYLLSDGSAGVYFNDSSKAIMAANGHDFAYITRKSTTGRGGGTRTLHTLGAYPPELHKKVTLLRHFRDYLVQGGTRGGRLHGSASGGGGDDASKPATGAQREQQAAAAAAAAAAEAASAPTQAPLSPAEAAAALDRPFVKRWLRTKHAILFRMSSRTVHVIFYDHTELLLSSEARRVTYANKYGVRASYALATVFQQPRPDLAKRVKYAKDLLQVHLLGDGGRPASASAAASASSAAGQQQPAAPSSRSPHTRPRPLSRR